MKTLTKVYESHNLARFVVNELEMAGFPSPSISLLAKPSISLLANKNISDQFSDVEDASQSAAGAGMGAAVGGAAGLLTGLGLLAIPGVGPVVAAGWFASTVVGALAGGSRVA